MLPKHAALSCQITTAPTSAVVDEIFRLVGVNQGYVAFANVHMLMEAEADPAFAAVVNGAAVACPDGAPVAMYLRRRYKIAQDRQAGMDMLPTLLQEAERRGKRVYFYGSTDQVLAAIRSKITADLPGLVVAGTCSPPFRPLSVDEQAALIADMVATKPDLVFVALGCPRQEKWMAAHQHQVPAVMLGVGQAFLTFAGLERRLPKALRKLPIEWLYRLALEPRRLFKRYAVTNTKFLLAVARERW